MDDRGRVEVSSVRIAASSGRIRVVAEPRGDVEVKGRASVGEEAGRTTITSGSGRVEVRLPTGCELVIGAGSGRVEVEGRLGHVAVVSDSGRVGIDEADSVDVRTSSGRVDVGRVAGLARIRSESSAVVVGSTGSADVATQTGRIDLPSVAGEARAHCVSGRIDIGLAVAADVEAETVSGRISVTLPPGVSVHRVTGLLPPDPGAHGCDCVVATRTVSGRVAVETR